MAKKYVLNSAVITSPGFYYYRLVNADFAKNWLRHCQWESTIGYEETAKALEKLTGVPVPVNRKIAVMEAGDEALVFRLVLPQGERRLPVDLKGRQGMDFILSHCEIGILRKISDK